MNAKALKREVGFVDSIGHTVTNEAFTGTTDDPNRDAAPLAGTYCPTGTIQPVQERGHGTQGQNGFPLCAMGC